MNKQLLLVYLAFVLLLQSKIEPLSIFLILSPLVILSYAFLIRNTTLGIVGFALFQLLTFPIVKLHNYENIGNTLFIIITMILPSLVLLEVILNLENKKIPKIKPKATPILTIVLLLTIIIGMLFVLTQISLFNIYLQTVEATTIQVLILASITIITCTPILEKRKV